MYKNWPHNLTYYDTDYTYSTLFSHQQQRTVPERGLQQKNTKNAAECFDSWSRQIENTQDQKKNRRKDIRDDEIREDTQEEHSTNDEYDQDSCISFENEEIEDWIEYIKRSTEEADENADIQHHN